ncbi:uncharacterized protein AMSG_10539 [Thecamonas trahens ATCC 50062]|uniref:Uncharacterized protein n=1 Tax=Thecamonas trahens ATCC 50062 TaxID=461836 RepID=A0A0L0DS67_THETB|nr:hypothetical protein AMSG_10539 [Thecamonas trahens ATCC 50062]KNC54886.1 hypothetical protein AMSG_10539 [Thecamonas trahens ATCC 50062]|eukprot:XP_013753478.1 hypothetical protein AMSG_10539 [Thecamonas trahens ATCC 50062]
MSTWPASSLCSDAPSLASLCSPLIDSLSYCQAVVGTWHGAITARSVWVNLFHPPIAEDTSPSASTAAPCPAEAAEAVWSQFDLHVAAGVFHLQSAAQPQLTTTAQICDYVPETGHASLCRVVPGVGPAPVPASPGCACAADELGCVIFKLAPNGSRAVIAGNVTVRARRGVSFVGLDAACPAIDDLDPLSPPAVACSADGFLASGLLLGTASRTSTSVPSPPPPPPPRSPIFGLSSVTLAAEVALIVGVVALLVVVAVIVCIRCRQTAAVRDVSLAYAVSTGRLERAMAVTLDSKTNAADDGPVWRDLPNRSISVSLGGVDILHTPFESGFESATEFSDHSPSSNTTMRSPTLPVTPSSSQAVAVADALVGSADRQDLLQLPRQGSGGRPGRRSSLGSRAHVRSASQNGASSTSPARGARPRRRIVTNSSADSRVKRNRAALTGSSFSSSSLDVANAAKRGKRSESCTRL